MNAQPPTLIRHSPHLTLFGFIKFLVVSAVAGLLVGRANAADLDPILLGTWAVEWEDEIVAVIVRDGYAFCATGPKGLSIVDVHNPANPKLAGGYDHTSGFAKGLAIAGNYAYVAGGAGLEVIDIRAPANPLRVGGLVTGGEAVAVAVQGSFAYVADGTNGLQVIDISNSVNPHRVGGYPGGH